MRKYAHRIAAAAVLAILACLPAHANEAVGEPKSETAYNHLVVASTTPLTGRFFSDQWGNGAADLDVCFMVHGYDLIRWNAKEGMFDIDPSVVSGSTFSENEAGDQSFRISLYQDMVFSDGTPITAENYVFSLLLGLAPQMRELGADITKQSYILGADAYSSGESDVLAGVRLTSDYEFTITIDHDYLPYFYELGLLDIVPYPIGVITPGYRVADDGEGVYFINEETKRPQPPEASLLKETLLDEENGYAAHPSVASGPYLLTEYDGEKAEFELNPNYKGNHEGIRPSIEKITFMTVSNAELIDRLKEGEIGLVNRVSDQEILQAGIEASAALQDISMATYPRSGLSFISFCSDSNDALEDPLVRQAFAWCLDRSALTKDYEARYGVPVTGWFGIGQWMYSHEQSFIETLPSYQAEEDEALLQAAGLLEEAGWTLNEKGEAFTPGTDKVRCRKEDDGTIRELDVTLACPAGNRSEQLLEQYFAVPLSKAGIHLTIEPVDGARLLNIYSGNEENPYDLLYLATNFSVVFDPCELFKENGEGIREWISTGIEDDELYELAVQMRRCEPGDIDTYRSRWQAFQTRFTQVLPVIPVYSNVYFDFYTSTLRNYDPAMSASWAQGVAKAYLSDAPAGEDAP